MTEAPAALSAKPWWRWIVYPLALGSTLVASMWVYGSFVVSSTMGWSGRSEFHVILLIAFVVVAPWALTVWCAIKAITSTQRNAPVRSTLFTIFGLAAVPIIVLSFNHGAFG